MTSALGTLAGAAVGGAVAAAATSGLANQAGNAVNSVLNNVPRLPATIICINPKCPGVVPFDFNPDQITINRTASVSTKSNLTGSTNPPGATPAIVRKVNAPTIALNDLVFQGLTTKLRCDTLLNWMSPYTAGFMAAIAALAGSDTVDARVLPTVTFSWGPPFVGFMYDVMITTAKITYVRFNNLGMPIRAKVTLNMVQVPSSLSTLPTNPTSGGLPGRQTHTATDGDSLQSIATRYYGRPGLWRQIARVNEISDPTRLRPGQRLFLPNAQELTQGGTG
jgi:nucleoid-associated protein YgaU